MRKLPKAPLQEAIFEVQWQLEPNEGGRNLVDPEYTFALGQFRHAIKDLFPYHVSLFPGEIPYQVLGKKVMHQFWKSQKQWPVVQIGPGIASLNDTEENYEWEKTYFPNIKFVLEAIRKSYDKIIFDMVSLRYIDVVRVGDYGMDTLEEFVHNHVNFDFKNQYDTRGKLSQFHFDQIFDLNEIGHLNVSFASGLNNKKETTFIWQTAIINQKVRGKEEVLSWVNEAHKHTSDLFKEICKNDFYASFNK